MALASRRRMTRKGSDIVISRVAVKHAMRDYLQSSVKQTALLVPADAELWQEYNTSTCAEFLGFRGKLQQGGNTCYMSASLQALFHSPSWEKVMALVDCTCELDTCPSCQVHQTYNGSARPEDILSLAVWNTFLENVGMQPQAQHDAEEFLKVLSNVWLTSPVITESARKDAKSFLHFFGHTSRLKVMRKPTCACYAVCEAQISFGNATREWMLMLDLPAGESEISVAELLRRHFRAEQAEGHEVLDACPNCKAPFDVRRQYEFIPREEVSELACCVRRYQIADDGKNRHAVHIDTVLSLPWGCFGLRGIVQHLGASCRGGHYLAWIRSLRGYCVYDDGSASLSPATTLPGFLKETVVLLFYTKLSKPIETVAEFVIRKCLQQAPAEAGRLAATSRWICGNVLNKRDFAEVCRGLQRGTEAPRKIDAGGVDNGDVPSHENMVADTAADASKVFLVAGQGQDRVSAAAKTLLAIFAEHCQNKNMCQEKCFAFLSSLPLYVSEEGDYENLATAGQKFNRFMSNLRNDNVNSTAAMQVKPYRGDCWPFAFVVLTHAASIATAIPAVFHESNFVSILSAMMHKNTYLQLGRFRNKNRMWSLCVANVGEGKSQAIDELRKAADKCCRDAGSAYTVGSASDGFHFLESSTNATALEKVRFCDGYMCIAMGDASRALDKAAAKGKATDKSQYISLEVFLDAAHGQQISHQTMDTRKAFAKSQKQRKTPNPNDPHTHPAPTELRETNVTLTLMCQDDCFTDYFAQIAVEYSVGIPQRFQIEYGGDCDPARAEHAHFYDYIFKETFVRVCKLLLLKCGPKIASGIAEPSFTCSEQQNKTFSDIEELLTMHKRQVDEYHMKPFKEACPKALYWLGSYITMNHLLTAFLPRAFANDPSAHFELLQTVRDDAWMAGLNGTCRKFLAGQHVLSTTAKERAWIGRRVAAISEYTATEKMMLRLLRCTAGSKLSVASLTAVDISLKRALRHPGTLAYDEACANIKEVLRVLQERGLGELFEEYSEDKYFPGQQYLHTYTWHSIDTAARKALLDARIPSHLFGACVAPRCGSALAKEGAGTEQEAARKEKDKNVLTKKMQLPVARSGVKTLTIIVNTQLEMPITLQETTKQLRILLGDRDEQAIVKAAHPQMDPYIHRSTGACRGTPSQACPVHWEGVFFRRQRAGTPVHTWMVSQIYEHNHAHAPQAMNSGRVLTPRQEAAAQAYVAATDHPTRRGVEQTLGAANLFPLPGDATLGAWLKRANMNKKKSKIPQQEEVLRSGGVSNVHQRAKIQAWMLQPDEKVDPHVLRVKPIPAPQFEDRLMVIFGCEAMERQVEYYQDIDIAISVDCKQGEMERKEGICDVNLLSKSELRNTTFGTYEGKKCQGRAFCTHGEPLVNGAFDVEGEEHFVQIFRATKAIIDTRSPGKILAVQRILQVHKDYAPGIEAARRRELQHSRPVNDFFHLMHHMGFSGAGKNMSQGSTLTKKMNPQNAVQTKNQYVYENQARIMAALQSQRRLPSIHLYSRLFEGSLVKWEHVLNEKVVADYLGAESKGGHAYTWKMRADVLAAPPFNIHTFGSPDEDLLFSQHWSGVGGMMLGMDCGDQCSEALHSGWQTATKALMGKKARAQGMEILDNMQVLYTEAWQKYFHWKAPRTTYLAPPKTDPSLRNGQALTSAGRSHAQALFEASEDAQKKHACIHVVIDVSDNTQVIAIVENTRSTFDEDLARKAARMLFETGEVLETSLIEANLLAKVKCADAQWRLVTNTSMVNDTFTRMAYVIVSKETRFYKNCRHGPICTCRWFGRYAQCEHIEFARTFGVRLFHAEYAMTTVPGSMLRGRPKNSTKVAVKTISSCKRKIEAAVVQREKSRKVGVTHCAVQDINS